MIFFYWFFIFVQRQTTVTSPDHVSTQGLQTFSDPVGRAWKLNDVEIRVWLTSTEVKTSGTGYTWANYPVGAGGEEVSLLPSGFVYWHVRGPGKGTIHQLVVSVTMRGGVSEFYFLKIYSCDTSQGILRKCLWRELVRREMSSHAQIGPQGAG